MGRDALTHLAGLVQVPGDNHIHGGIVAEQLCDAAPQDLGGGTSVASGGSLAAALRLPVGGKEMQRLAIGELQLQLQ